MRSTENKIISIAIYSVWGILIIFGVLTLIQPAWLKELSEPGKDVEARSISDKGDNFLKNKQYPSAISNYIQALKIVPDLKKAIANLGIAYQKSGQYSKAIIVFNRLLEMDPEYPDIIYFNLANIYENTGKTDEAIKYYLLAADASANPEDDYQRAGRLYMENNNLDKAIACFIKAVDNKRTIENAYKSMLIVQEQSISDTTQEYRQISTEIESESYKNNLSGYDASIYNYLLAHDINLAKTYNNIGYCLALQKNYEESIQYLKSAIQIDPSFKDAKNNLRAVEGFIEKEK